ncbi:MFS transporter [Companilactobacillus muriivasis]|uniref:MFS transporter n=1 Tax=Companilactobacillus muriivasis TaxID=3081444 RepID=UPI0030C70BCD
MIPSIQILTVRNVPKSIFGRIFSYNQSAHALGNFLGPMLAAWIAIGFGYKSIFLFSSLLELLSLGSWLYYSNQRKAAQT